MSESDTNALLAAILGELRQIRAVQQLLARASMDELQGKLESRYLTTDERRNMYRLADGRRTVSDIAREVKKTPEAVRQLMAELERAGYVQIVKDGKASVLRRLL